MRECVSFELKCVSLPTTKRITAKFNMKNVFEKIIKKNEKLFPFFIQGKTYVYIDKKHVCIYKL